MTNIEETTTAFFRDYAQALVVRDETAIARMYGTPSLILFPDNAIAVGSLEQTEQFFASSWDQYDGVTTAESRIVVMGHAPGSIWADVTWSYGGQERERFCYQLVYPLLGSDGSYRIAVLTPMSLPEAH